MGSSQRHHPKRGSGPELHGDLADLVFPQLLGTALLGDVHAVARHRLACFGGALHAAADHGFGTVHERSGDDRSVWNNTMNLGFYSPFHPIPGISSGQYDLSLEQHFRGTDMSFKLTPFYTWVSNWQQQTFIGSGFVTQVPVGVNRN